MIELPFQSPEGYDVQPPQKLILQDSQSQAIGDGVLKGINDKQASIEVTSTPDCPVEDIKSFIPNGIPAKVLEDPCHPDSAYGPGPAIVKESQVAKKVGVLIAGGGMGGSSLFRYFSEAGLNPVLVNEGQGGSWRNIAGGRSNFSLPELSEIAGHNRELFQELQSIRDVGFRDNKYVTFAHNDEIYNALEKSMEWTEAEMILPKDFATRISPHINPKLDRYKSALIADNCWQGIPGRVITLLREIGVENGGVLYNHTKVVDVSKEGEQYRVTVKHNSTGVHETFICDHFVNALGAGAGGFAKKLGIEINLHAAVHQAFITNPLPMLGIDGDHLPMMIERRIHRGFSAVYAQQFGLSGQIIGCASPATESDKGGRTIKASPKEFVQYITEILEEWLPNLKPLDLQAVWSGCYIEPRMIIDPELGLFAGLKGHGFMQSQYLAKMYVDNLLGREVPTYFERLKLNGDGLKETMFK